MQLTASPDATVNVAVRGMPLVVLLYVTGTPVHVRSLSVQPDCSVSETDFWPAWAAGITNVLVFGSAGSESSSSENPLVQFAGPVPVVVYAKFCGSLGSASFVTVM